MSTTVRFFAGARAAAGMSSQDVDLPDGATLADLLTHLEGAHGPGFARVLTASSVLVDEVSWRDRSAPLPSGATIDVLPPFAGG